MKMYSTHGINDFIICCGYKEYLIKEYFANYLLHMSDVTVNVADHQLIFHNRRAENWKVTLIDTGEQSETGGRLKLVKDYLADDDFCFTYGDGVSDINITQLVNYHKNHGKLATVTAVQPQGRFGAIEIEENAIKGFHEKPIGDGGWINGGFFVLNPKVISEIENDKTIWE